MELCACLTHVFSAHCIIISLHTEVPIRVFEQSFWWSLNVGDCICTDTAALNCLYMWQPVSHICIVVLLTVAVWLLEHIKWSVAGECARSGRATWWLSASAGDSLSSPSIFRGGSNLCGLALSWGIGSHSWWVTLWTVCGLFINTRWCM